MNQNLTDDLVSGFKIIKDDFLTLQDEARRKALIQETCHKIAGRYDERIAINTMNIINYYMAAGKVDIDRLIKFLTVNSDLDYETIQREERDGFDKKFGTTTSLIIRQYELPEQVSLQRFQTSGRCHPTPVASMKMALQQLAVYNVQYHEFVFIDIGAGLGRNLLLAADYPFKKIIGIEHSQYLTDRMQDNLKIYRSDSMICHNIELQCIDALEYTFPQDNVVWYFWRPFTEEIAAEFVEKIEHFIRTTSFNVVLLSLGMAYAAVKQSALLDLVDIFYTPDLIDGNGEQFPLFVYANKGYAATLAGNL